MLTPGHSDYAVRGPCSTIRCTTSRTLASRKRPRSKARCCAPLSAARLPSSHFATWTSGLRTNDAWLINRLFLLPASRAPLARVFVGGHNILLAYANAKARVWNVETREFRRSTGLDAADDMVSQPGWAEVDLKEPPALTGPVTKVVGETPNGSDLGRLLQLDLRKLGQTHSGSASPLPALRGLLSVFLTFGVNPAIDEVCTSNLGVTPPRAPAAVGLEGWVCGQHGEVTNCTGRVGRRPSRTLRRWTRGASRRPRRDCGSSRSCRFSDHSSIRQVRSGDFGCVLTPDHETWAADVIAFYASCLPHDAIEAELELFAAFYLDSCPDVHQAARMLFGARISRMSNTEIEALVDAQQSHCEQGNGT